MRETELHQAAIDAGASVLGDPPHYLMDAAQLAVFVALLREPPPPSPDMQILAPPPY